MIFRISASNRRHRATLNILWAALPAAMLAGPARWGAAGPEPWSGESMSVEVGNEACRPCHETIYSSYSRTAMARTSGRAVPDLEGSFTHARWVCPIACFETDNLPSFRPDRSGTTALHGTQVPEYYVGSNTRGRAFLFEIDGFLYQTPINYYAATNSWDMSPGYGQLREMELNHPVDATCLFVMRAACGRRRRVRSMGLAPLRFCKTASAASGATAPAAITSTVAHRWSIRRD